MYDVKSPKAEEFICHEEILATLAFAEENKHNRELLDAILEKAKTCAGLSHREAAVLLECDLEEYKEKVCYLYPKVQNTVYTLRDALKSGRLYKTDVPVSEGQKYPEEKKKVLELVPPG